MSKRLLRGMLPLAMAATAISCCLLSTAGSAGALPASSAPAAPPGRAAQWWLRALGVPQAWRASGLKPPGAGVTVAVLSTGVDGAHPDLTGAVTAGPDDSGSGARQGDPFWGTEGTAVASLIAGHGHGAADPGGVAGSLGITGIAPGAKVLSLRVTLEFNDPRNGQPAITRRLPDAIAAGIRYAVSHGASVIALPLDPGTLGPVMTGDPSAAGGSAREMAAVRDALAHGVVLVAPAGDNGASTGSVTYPAAYPGVLAVGATDQAGNLESYSNRGAYVALTAPGDGLTVAAPGGGYLMIKTTDMSAALTAGVAALIRAKYPRLSPAQVIQAITHGTGSLSASGAVSTAGAIATGLQPSPPSPTAASSAAVTAAPPASLRATPGGASASPGGNGTAGSLVQDAAMAAGALIAVLIVALAAVSIRQRRVRAARARHVPRPHEPAHAGRTGTGGFPAAITGGFPSLSSHGAHAAPRGSTGGQPVLAPGRDPAASHSGGGQRLGPGARMPRGFRPRAQPPAGSAPAARDAAPPVPAPTSDQDPARPAAQGPRATALTLPPWAPVPAELSSPAPADVPGTPDWDHGTSPMYTWDPTTNSGPFPAFNPEDSASQGGLRPPFDPPEHSSS